MKIPSKLLSAMLITAAIGATTTGCKIIKPQSGDDDRYHILPAEEGGIIGKIRDVFRPAPAPCPACGMG